jgi:transcriptional regulator with XRE-family HTH domain
VSTEIRVLLARHGRTQADLADYLGLSAFAVSRRMTGAITWDVDELQQVADYFQVGVRDLLPTPAAS